MRWRRRGATTDPTGAPLPWLERLAARATLRNGVEHPETLRARNDLAAAYLQAGRADDAVRELAPILPLCRAVLGERDADTLVVEGNLAAAHLGDGRPDLALPLLERALALRTEVWGADHPRTADARHGLGLARSTSPGDAPVREPAGGRRSTSATPHPARTTA